MKRQLKRALTAVLALGLLLASGCKGGGPSPTAPAMGRYVETKLTLPESFFEILSLRRSGDGSVDLLGFVGDAGGKVLFKSYRSTDSGLTWTQQPDTDMLAEINSEDADLQPVAAAWAGDGTPWLFLYRYSEAGRDTGFFARSDGEGALEALPWPVPKSGDGSGVRGFKLAENGDLIVDYYSEFMQLDAATGAVKHVYTVKNGNGDVWNDGWTLTGNTLALSENDHISFYDLNTGEQTGTVACTSDQSATAMSTTDNFRSMDYGADGALYFTDATGLYRAVDGSDVLEQVADGGLNSLSAPSLTHLSLAALDGQFLLLGFTAAERYTLLSYSYDPDVPTLPGSSLSIYSLEDDPLIRQAITQFQLGSPSVYVSYEVGVPEDGSVTRDDALRTLATQLTAGQGPDILVLDGMPIDSYIEKGVLTDLSDLMTELNGGGETLPNVLSAYAREDGTAYVLPAQFRVPLLHGSDDAVDASATLSGMADWLEANRTDYNHPLNFIHSTSYLRLFYPLFADSLKTADGGMDAGKLSAFLADLDRVYTLEQDKKFDDGVQYDDFYFQFGALQWMGGSSGLDVGELGFFEGLYCAWTASRDKEDGRIEPMFGMDAFRPLTLLGVSTQSKEGELARDFIRCALSEEVQDTAVGNGLPVNAAAFETSTQIPEDMRDNEGRHSFYSLTLGDAEGASVPIQLYVYYPPEEWRNEFADRIRALDTPLLYDETVLQLIIDGTQDFFAGRADLDSTVTSLMEKLSLYEAE